METYNRTDKYIITHQLVFFQQRTNMAHLEIFLSFLKTVKST